MFALCIIDREDRAIVRKFTKPVEVDLREDVERLPVPRRSGDRGTRARSRSHASSARSGNRRGREPHLFLGEVVNAAFLKDEATEVLRMEDTRMNYGG